MRNCVLIVLYSCESRKVWKKEEGCDGNIVPVSLPDSLSDPTFKNTI